MTHALIVSAVCLLLQAFFAGSEIALIGCDRIAIRQGAQQGHRTARLLDGLLSASQRFLATTLVGTQLSVVVSTVNMTVALRKAAPAHVELLLLACLLPATVVLGEIVPKTLAQQRADSAARLVVYPLWAFSKLIWPLVFVLTRLVGWVLRILGIPERKLVTREELELMLRGPAVKSGPGGGEITEGERKMISRIFDFTDKTIYDVMVPLSDVAALSEEATLDQLAAEIEDKQYTRYPVYRERVDRIVGTVHAFDLLKAGRAQVKVGTIARAPLFVPQNQPAVDLLVELQRARQGMAIVVDEYGGAVGVATIEDILEEIVGEIDDEHDVRAPAIRKEADGVWRISARVKVSEVNRELKLDLPEGDYESIGGLLLERLKHIPREGESVRAGNVLLKVTKASERAVEEVQLRIGRRKSPSPGPGTLPG